MWRRQWFPLEPLLSPCFHVSATWYRLDLPMAAVDIFQSWGKHTMKNHPLLLLAPQSLQTQSLNNQHNKTLGAISQSCKIWDGPGGRLSQLGSYCDWFDASLFWRGGGFDISIRTWRRATCQTITGCEDLWCLVASPRPSSAACFLFQKFMTSPHLYYSTTSRIFTWGSCNIPRASSYRPDVPTPTINIFQSWGKLIPCKMFPLLLPAPQLYLQDTTINAKTHAVKGPYQDTMSDIFLLCKFGMDSKGGTRDLTIIAIDSAPSFLMGWWFGDI